MTAITDIQEVLEARLAELRAEQDQLEKALAALEQTPGRRRPGRPRGSRTGTQNGRAGAARRRRRRRGTSNNRGVSPEEMERLRDYVSSNPEANTDQIAEALGITKRQAAQRLRRLRAAGA